MRGRSGESVEVEDGRLQTGEEVLVKTAWCFLMFRSCCGFFGGGGSTKVSPDGVVLLKH